MRISLADMLATHDVILADGATATNFFQRGLESGYPPELWNIEHPQQLTRLHQEFVDAGADLILTNSFGGTRQRLKLHKADDRVFELAEMAARIACAVADAADRPVVVAGSVGPTGELFEPLGALTHDVAVASFREQIEGLIAGGADVVWIETMSSVEEVRAAAQAAIDVGVPYTATWSFDTAGRTMTAEGFAVSRMSEAGYGTNQLMRWEFDGRIGWGEDQDVWNAEHFVRMLDALRAWR